MHAPCGILAAQQRQWPLYEGRHHPVLGLKQATRGHEEGDLGLVDTRIGKKRQLEGHDKKLCLAEERPRRRTDAQSPCVQGVERVRAAAERLGLLGIDACGARQPGGSGLGGVLPLPDPPRSPPSAAAGAAAGVATHRGSAALERRGLPTQLPHPAHRLLRQPCLPCKSPCPSFVSWLMVSSRLLQLICDAPHHGISAAVWLHICSQLCSFPVCTPWQHEPWHSFMTVCFWNHATTSASTPMTRRELCITWSLAVWCALDLMKGPAGPFLMTGLWWTAEYDERHHCKGVVVWGGAGGISPGDHPGAWRDPRAPSGGPRLLSERRCQPGTASAGRCPPGPPDWGAWNPQIPGMLGISPLLFFLIVFHACQVGSLECPQVTFNVCIARKMNLHVRYISLHQHVFSATGTSVPSVVTHSWDEEWWKLARCGQVLKVEGAFASPIEVQAAQGPSIEQPLALDQASMPEVSCLPNTPSVSWRDAGINQCRNVLLMLFVGGLSVECILHQPPRASIF